MANFYNLDGIKTALKKEIEEKEAILKAWENVTFPTKKNGEPFVNMSKNINGATYKKADYGLSANNVELKKQLEIADKAYAGFRKVYEDAMAVLDNVTETKKDEYSFLKSSILDTIKNRYPYC
jgi:hypothetical protein